MSNTAPTITSPLETLTVMEGEKIKIQLGDFFADAEGNKLRYKVRGDDRDFSSWINAKNELVIVGTEGQVGTYDIEIRFGYLVRLAYRLRFAGTALQYSLLEESVGERHGKQSANAFSPGGFAEYGYIFRVAAKSENVFLHPTQCGDLVEKSFISG